ncbi:MAG: hypothetical protein JW820_09825, partial [Spirochaetales bacterium]|nr:hypothetical protein [Spirochaetales bacterium]
YREALESLRLAPSASNRQPWRGLLSGTQRLGRELHLFLCRTPGYRQAGAIDLQRMDMGIAMAHFQLGLEAAAPAEAGRGRWQVLAPEPRLPEFHPPGPARSSFQNLEYVVSWRPDG